MPSSFETLLREECSNCTESSIRTYTYNIRALAKIAGHDRVPMHSKWLNKKLLAEVKKLPLGQYKKFAIAGQKALKAYGDSRKIWAQAVRDSGEKYNKQRNTQKRTKREDDNWPEGGYKALVKLAEDLREDTEYILDKAPSAVSKPQLYKLQQWFVVVFYSKHALRGDLAEVQIKKRGSNYIYQRDGSKDWNIHIGEHKTSKSNGAIDFKLDPAVNTALKEYLPYVKAKTKHGYLLSTKRGASKMSRRDMLKMLRNLTEEKLGKRLGVQMIRVLKTTDSKVAINEAAKLRRELGHGARTQFQYVSR